MVLGGECGRGTSVLLRRRELYFSNPLDAKALVQSSHVQNDQNRKHVVKRSLQVDTAAPGPFQKCPADLPKSNGLRLRVRMK